MAGSDDIAPGVEIEGTEEALAKLNALGDAGEEAFKKIADAADKVGNSTQGLDQMADKAKSAFTDISAAGAEAFSKILDAATSGNFTGVVTHMFGELAGTITDVTEKAVAFVEAQASVAETMSNLAEATGMTVGEIGGLRDAFASVGISTNGFERSVGRLAITIANEWSQIQQSVRTSADSQMGAMLNLQGATNAVAKSYTAMNEALTHASQTAAHDAIGIQEAALGLRKASQDLGDFALTARGNALSVESAQLALVRARMNLQKDQGYAVNPADEKALKIEQDKVAVKDAELKLDEAKNKKAKEGMEMEELTLKLKKAKMEVSDAETKQQEDAVKSQEKIKDAALGIDKAQLARSEASEKQHETDLKNIPAIAKEIDAVANKQKEWKDVINHTELSAQNMTKALVLAASPGGGQEPQAMDLFREMSKLFKNMGDDADSMNKKLAIVQHTMGAGFRAGQASAAQLLAVLERGPDALEKFMAEAEKFSKIKIGGFDLKESFDQLKEFNAASSQLSAAFDQIKTRFAAMMAVPMAQWFTELKDSMVQPTGALHTLAIAVGELFQVITRVVSGVVGAFGGFVSIVNEVVQLFGRLFGMDPGVALAAMGVAALGLAAAFGGIVQKLAVLIVTTAAWTGLIGLVTTAVGDLVKAWALLPSWMGGGKGTFDEGKKIEEMGQAVTRAAAKMVGISDKQMDADVKKNGEGSLSEGIFGKDKARKEAEAQAQDFSGLRARKDALDKENGNKGGSDGGAAIKDAAAAQKDAATATKTGGDAVKDAGTTLGQGSSTLSAAAGALGQVAQAFGTVISNIAHGRSPSDVSGKAGGGKITGPGGPRDDTAGLFALSDGEFVMQSAAVSHYGEGLFAALNSLSVGGFATGGSVGRASAPNIGAGMGSGGPQSVLNLKIGDHEFNGLRAPDHVASRLKQFAVGRQSSSAGKSPSWVR